MQLLSWNPSLLTTVQFQLIKSHLATLTFQRCLMVLENNDTLTEPIYIDLAKVKGEASAAKLFNVLQTIIL